MFLLLQRKKLDSLSLGAVLPLVVGKIDQVKTVN